MRRANFVEIRACVRRRPLYLLRKGRKSAARRRGLDPDAITAALQF
jgi:hypothetical protein